MLGAFLDEMAGFELTIWTAVHAFHVYNDFWMPTIAKDFVGYHQWDNEHDRHAVAVYKEEDDVHVDKI